MTEISAIIRARLDEGRSISDEDVRKLLAERDALQKKGCARDQKTTQFCAEATALQAQVAELEALVAYLCGRNTDHIQVALAGNPIVVDALVKRAEDALERKKE